MNHILSTFQAIPKIPTSGEGCFSGQRPILGISISALNFPGVTSIDTDGYIHDLSSYINENKETWITLLGTQLGSELFDLLNRKDGGSHILVRSNITLVAKSLNNILLEE